MLSVNASSSGSSRRAFASFQRGRDRFLDFLSKSEGRDKFSKVLQFLARLTVAMAREKKMFNSNIWMRLERFWKAMLDARRMSWFGKSMLELKTVQATLANMHQLPKEVCYCHAISRMFFALRWTSENRTILRKIRVLQGPWQPQAMRSAQLWGAACVFGIMTEVLKLRRLYCDNADLTPEQRRHVRNLLLRTILVHLCDMAVPARVGLGFAIPEKQLAGMHLVAAMIQCGNLFPAPAPFRML